MLCGALMDSASCSRIEDSLNAFRGTKITVHREKSRINGISGTKVSFKLEGNKAPADFEGIKNFVESSSLEKETIKKVIDTYSEIFRAEAAVHGIKLQQVKLHELSVPRKIAEISAFHILTQGQEIFFSMPLLGCGTAETAHGRIPIPSPATAEILKGVGVSFTQSEKEMVTPSAAALLKVSGRSARPDMLVSEIGYGIGKSSILRVFIGEKALYSQAGCITEIEFNIDDMTPEDIAFFTEKISLSAVDFWITPVVMKKSRPGHLITILADEKNLEAVQNIIFENTTTAGIRLKNTGRSVLKRETVDYKTSLGACRIKKYILPSGKVRIKPEYDDLKQLAGKNNISIEQAREKITTEFNKK